MDLFENHVYAELERHANSVPFLKKNLERLISQWDQLFQIWCFCPSDENAVELSTRLTVLQNKIAANAARLEKHLPK
jgi:hypothetical protein